MSLNVSVGCLNFDVLVLILFDNEQERVCKKQTSNLIGVWEKVFFKSQILVHEYWTILDHFEVPVLSTSE